LAFAENPPPTEATIETSIHPPSLSRDPAITPGIYPRGSYFTTPDVDTDMLDRPILPTTMALLDENISPIALVTAAPGAAEVLVEGDTRTLTYHVNSQVSRAFLNRPPLSHTYVRAEADVAMLPDRVQSPIYLPHPSPPMPQNPSHRPLPHPAVEMPFDLFAAPHLRLPHPAMRAEDLMSLASSSTRMPQGNPTHIVDDNTQPTPQDALPPIENPVFPAAQTPIAADMLPLDADRIIHAVTPAESRTTPIFPPPPSTPGTADISGLSGVAQYLHDTVEHALRANLAETLESSADRALEKFIDKHPHLKRTRKGKERAQNDAESDPDDGMEENDELQRRKKRRKGPRGPVTNHLHVCSSSYDLTTFPLLNAVYIGGRAVFSPKERFVRRTKSLHTRTSSSDDDRSVSA
jgi:hypothetical protein